MRSDPFGLVRSLVVSIVLAASADAFAQPRISFDVLDLDANGLLLGGEFSQLPGFAGSSELFVDLDANHDRAVSREEWLAGVPDERGIPLGFHAAARQAAAAGVPAGTAPQSTRHGPNVPQRPTGDDPRNVRPPPLDSARLSGSQDTKRGLSPGPPRPSAIPTPLVPRPPGG
jgi:hypothetical protein